MMMEPQYHPKNLTKRFRKIYIFFFLGVILISVAFTISLVLSYQHLNHRLTELMTATTLVYEKDDNITTQLTELTSMEEVTEKIVNIQDQIDTHEHDMKDLQLLVEEMMNLTAQQLNNTVNQVHQDVQDQVDSVNHDVKFQNSLIAYQFAATFTLLGSFISIWHMGVHLRNFHEPFVQRKIIALLWMIPIYSITSWVGLIVVSAQGYLSLVKDVYEAYVIYTFLAFLIAVLGRGDRNAVVDLLAQKAEHLRPPMRLFFWRKRHIFDSSRHKAEAILDQCQFFAMQFVFIRPVTSLGIAISDSIHESRWNFKYPQVYFMIIVNISVFFAFSGLVKFYHAVHDDLSWCNPFNKFLCIKGVVFMTFWQSILLSFLAEAIYDTDDDELDATEWSKRAQNFLICLEMFFFAIIHCFVFPPEEWEEGYKEKQLQLQNLHKKQGGDNLALRDFFKDVRLVMMKNKSRSTSASSSGNNNKKKKKKRSKKKENSLYLKASHGHDGGWASDDCFSADNSDEEDLDIDWSQGWSRIERYIETIDVDDDGNTKDDDNSSDYEKELI